MGSHLLKKTNKFKDCHSKTLIQKLFIFFIDYESRPKCLHLYYDQHTIMAHWKVVHTQIQIIAPMQWNKSQNYQHHDGHSNYLNNRANRDETSPKITNITIDVTTKWIITLVMMNQVSNTNITMDIATITMYTKCTHIITMQTNTHVSNEHKHQDIKEQTSHLNTSYTKNEMKSTSALEI